MSSSWLAAAPCRSEGYPKGIDIQAELEKAKLGSLDDLAAFSGRVEGQKDIEISSQIAQAALDKMEAAGVPWHHALDMLLFPRGGFEQCESLPWWPRMEVACKRFSVYIKTAHADPMDFFLAFPSNKARSIIVEMSPRWSVGSMRDLNKTDWVRIFLATNPAVTEEHRSAIADACVADGAQAFEMSNDVLIGTLVATLVALLSRGWSPTKKQQDAIWKHTGAPGQKGGAREWPILSLLPVLCHERYPLSSEHLHGVSFHNGRPRTRFLEHIGKVLAQPGRTADDAWHIAGALERVSALETTIPGDPSLYSGISHLLDSPWGTQTWSVAWRMLHRASVPDLASPPGSSASPENMAAWRSLVRTATPRQYAEVWDEVRQSYMAREVLASGTPEQWAALGLSGIEDLANSSDGDLRKAVILASGYARDADASGDAFSTDSETDAEDEGSEVSQELFNESPRGLRGGAIMAIHAWIRKRRARAAARLGEG